MPRGELALLTPEPGTIVGEKYRILRLLGEGGMGSVYEAENTLTLKRAAIKWLHPRLVNLEEAGKRLLHEARAMARVRHRNVVDIYDVVTEQSSVFLVMELLLGEQLSALLARETLSAAQLITLLLPAMRGVAAAHAAGVIHRDIKPDNILLVREPGQELTPKVIDFGISRFFEPDEGRLTRSGMTMGTPRYVSYEQLRGTRDVDHRTDIYAFGVILYECLVGHPPYQANSFGEQAISFVTTEPPRPRKVRPELPEPLDALVYSAIAKLRDDRPSSMEALISGLTPFADESAYPHPISITPPVEPNAQTADIYGQITAPGTVAPSAVKDVLQAGNAVASFRSGEGRSFRPNWPLFSVGALTVAALFAVLWPRSSETHVPHENTTSSQEAREAAGSSSPPAERKQDLDSVQATALAPDAEVQQPEAPVAPHGGPESVHGRAPRARKRRGEHDLPQSPPSDATPPHALPASALPSNESQPAVEAAPSEPASPLRRAGPMQRGEF